MEQDTAFLSLKGTIAKQSAVRRPVRVPRLQTTVVWLRLLCGFISATFFLTGHKKTLDTLGPGHIR